jgi:glycolate oxidase
VQEEDLPLSVSATTSTVVRVTVHNSSEAIGPTAAATHPATDLVAALRAVLPADRVVTDPDVLASYAHDEAEWAEHVLPVAAVRPRTPEEVQAVVRACIENRTPVVPRGAGTGLSGGANATAGCVVVSLEAMDAVLEVDELERFAVVQPGVINDDLRAHVAGHGLWYPPDPASSPWSTIGGNVATNAGGLCCVKYGVTRDYVMGVQVVTGTGELVRLGRRTAKGVAGYDLTGLMVGSEGTLGIVTEVTVKLRPLRDPERTVAGYFDSVVAAGEAVTAVAAAGLTPSALELVDRHCLAAVDAWKNMGLSADAEVVLLGRVDTPGAAGDAEAEQMLAAFQGAGASWAAVSTDAEEADALFAARRLAYPALERLGPVLTEDVCVPKAAVPAMLARIEQIGAAHNILIANIAHAGDGNLHPLLITPPGDDAARDRAQLAFHEIIAAALELGGTVTGEHGIGLLKRDGLAAEIPPAVLAMHHAVKAALDPHGILNPGKVFTAPAR